MVATEMHAWRVTYEPYDQLPGIETKKKSRVVITANRKLEEVQSRWANEQDGWEEIVNVEYLGVVCNVTLWPLSDG